MLEIFKNKKICFFGASLTSHGHFLYYIRQALKDSVDKCLVYNCGISGLRADLVYKELIEDQICEKRPDYCIVSFGANDLGIWLYDGLKTEDEEIKRQKEERNNNYFKGITNIVNILKEKGIEPVLMTPCPVNEFLIEEKNIETLADNKEKGELIGKSFYTRKTFRNINKGFTVYNEFLKDLAIKNGIMFFDNFESLKQKFFAAGNAFSKDGIHITKTGGEIYAEEVLKHLGVINPRFKEDKENDALHEKEQVIRQMAFVRYNCCNPLLLKKDKVDVFEEIKNILEDKNSPSFMKNNCKVFLENYKDIDSKNIEYNTLVKNYIYS